MIFDVRSDLSRYRAGDVDSVICCLLVIMDDHAAGRGFCLLVRNANSLPNIPLRLFSIKLAARQKPLKALSMSR